MSEMRILLIEDNPEDVQVLKRKLYPDKYVLSHAENLSDALKLLDKETFDVILLDISLPDSFGVDSFYKIRSKSHELPIVVLTGIYDDKLIKDLLQNGVQDYLIKDTLEHNLIWKSITYAVERQSLIVSLNRKTEEIRVLKESMEYLVSNTTDGIIIVDTQGKIRFANPAAGDIFSNRKEKLIGEDFRFPISTNRSVEINIAGEGDWSPTCEMRSVEIVWENKPAYLLSIRDITERKKLENQIEYQSFHDKLTGLYNRAYFDMELKRLDTERQLPISIIIGDMNNLKLINDALGHLEGDKLLCKVARILKESCRNEDIVVRLGGDEYVILLPQCSEITAVRVADKIRAECKKHKSASIPISIALGVASKENNSEAVADVFALAESRMYTNKLSESKSARSSVVAMLEKSLYEKDYLTEEHTIRVRELCEKFANHIHLSGNLLDELILLASLHDIGKIAVPEEVLRKEDFLNDEEWEIIKKHPETGYRITKVTYGLGHIAEAILTHHERWDGKGYPDKLSGEKIPYLSRILSVIDSYDVMTHKRPYKKAKSVQEAVDEIMTHAGTQFDPELAYAFVEFLNGMYGKNMR